MSRDNLRWWGWGTLDQTYDLSERPGFWPFLSEELGLTGEERGPQADLDRITLPASRLSPDDLDALTAIVGAEHLSAEHKARVTHAVGKSYPDLMRLRLGQIEHAPDVVVWPGSEEEVAALLALAVRRHWSVIPFGGGSSVTGGLTALGEWPAISLDLARLNQVLAVDPISHTVTAQAGILGPALEQALNVEGFTLGHFPQSFEFSTLGGWIATRAAGQQSIRYGKIEDMVEWLRMVTPQGVIETRHVPASAAGPSLKEMLVGSEGAFGVITQATMRLRPLPTLRDTRGLLFRSFADGVAAIRAMMQSDRPPAMARLSDVAETRAYQALSPARHGRAARLTRTIGTRLMKRRGIELHGACLMILGCEGDEQSVPEDMDAALTVCAAQGAFHLGRSPGEAWYAERFALPYLRDVLLDHGVLVDTLETATTWDNLLPLYQAVGQAIAEAIEAEGVKPLVMCHVSHAYTDGASLYYTFLARQVAGREIAQWELIKRRATETIMQHGGTLSHHHGVGSDHRPWLEREHGPLGVAALRALKHTFDPYGVMNPGKLLEQGP
ncbi:MAG: FAD-binding oxidoreductase [Anaerolineae bacterium]|nr:FAD-binding oxidoreductase [Anaerolineae bacterium]